MLLVFATLKIVPVLSESRTVSLKKKSTIPISLLRGNYLVITIQQLVFNNNIIISKLHIKIIVLHFKS